MSFGKSFLGFDAAVAPAPFAHGHSEAGAEKEVERLISYGIRAFWNFTHYDISNEFPDAIVEDVHLSDSLMTLSYQIKCSF